MVISGLLLMMGLYMRNQKNLREYGEDDYIQELREATKDPEPQLVALPLGEVEEDRHLGLDLQQLFRTEHNAISRCLSSLPQSPGHLRIRLRSDPAGRLTELSLPGIPDTQGTCLLRVLKKGSYPRSVDAEAVLPLVY